MRVVAGGHRVLWFVQKDVHFLLHLDCLVVELHVVGAQNLGSEFGNNLAVHRNYACLDELVSLAAAANTGVGEELIEAYRLCRVYVLFLIFNAFLQAVLCVRVVVGRALTVTALTVVAALALLPVRVALVAATVVAALTLLIAAFSLVGVVAWTITTLLVLAVLALTGLEAAFRVGIVTRTITALLVLAVLALTGLVATFLVGVVTRTVALRTLSVL